MKRASHFGKVCMFAQAFHCTLFWECSYLKTSTYLYTPAVLMIFCSGHLELQCGRFSPMQRCHTQKSTTTVPSSLTSRWEHVCLDQTLVLNNCKYGSFIWLYVHVHVYTCEWYMNFYMFMYMYVTCTCMLHASTLHVSVHVHSESMIDKSDAA